MMNDCRSCLLLITCLCSLTGCADGPFTELAGLNPYFRQEWERDQRFGPTYHDQVAELRAIRQNPRGLAPAEQAETAQLLSALVHDSANPVLRAEAVLALAELRSAETVPALRKATEDADADVRVAACAAWARVGGADAAATLTAILERDADLDVRMAAADALGSFKDNQQAVQGLAIALNDDDPALQYRAVKSLQSVTGRAYGDNVPAWREFVQGGSPQVATPSFAERIMSFRWF